MGREEGRRSDARAKRKTAEVVEAGVLERSARLLEARRGTTTRAWRERLSPLRTPNARTEALLNVSARENNIKSLKSVS